MVHLESDAMRAYALPFGVLLGSLVMSAIHLSQVISVSSRSSDGAELTGLSYVEHSFCALRLPRGSWPASWAAVHRSPAVNKTTAVDSICCLSVLKARSALETKFTPFGVVTRKQQGEEDGL